MRKFQKIAAILFGSLLIAFGINFYLIPFKILDGGVIGIALICKYKFGWLPGLTLIMCSAPIFMLAWRRYRPFFYNSLYGMLASSLLIDSLYPYQYHFLYFIELTPLQSAIAGGCLIGAGIGIMLRNRASTGGTELLAHWLSDKYSINVGYGVFFIDFIIVLIGGLLISVETLLLSTITILAGGITTGLITLRHDRGFR